MSAAARAEQRANRIGLWCDQIREAWANEFQNADAVINSLIADVRAATLLAAADHFDNYDEVTIGDTDIGSSLIPVAPADRLRALAEDGGV